MPFPSRPRSKPAPPRVRLNLYLARAGRGSRREAEGWVREGRVTVNGGPPEGFGVPIDPARDRVTLDGRLLHLPADHRYLAYHKPPGTLVSRRSQGGKPTIYQRLGEKARGLHAIGRLDYDSEGLLLLTDDGTLAEAILHPRSELRRRYRVWVSPVPDAEHMRRLIEGTVVEGVAVMPDGAVLEGADRGYGIVRIDLREGKKREIRVLATNAGLDVHQLLRISFGPVRLGVLKRGAVRPLTAGEVEALRKAAVPRGARLSRGGRR
jgi:23S rRNA pseudouridine2605 synthase